jgi:hypothetical protein
MWGNWTGKLGCLGVALIAAAWAFQATHAQEATGSNLTYSRGQPVIPAYNGWFPNADGTINLWFGYVNQNWREEPDVPIGPDNNISPAPYGPDAGQPTHLLPRNNRFVFSVRVPKDFADKEVVWTLTVHGKTYRAYATLNPAYLHDEIGMQREYFGEPPEGNQPPTLQMERDARRAVKVGQPSTLTLIATDDQKNRTVTAARIARGTATGSQRLSVASECDDPRVQFCGEPNQGAGGRFSVKGLRVGCFLYRGGPDTRPRGDFGNAALVTFTPRQEKMWEDNRGGSPWAAGYTLPPIPPDNKWIVQTAFQEPGTYVVRCLAHDGFLQTPRDTTFTVTR